MKRVEIVLNQAVKDEFISNVENMFPNLGYTFLDEVKGKGKQGKRLIDSIWPEESALLIIYTHDLQFNLLKNLFFKLKVKYPKEGLKFYYIDDAKELVLDDETRKHIIVEKNKD